MITRRVMLAGGVCALVLPPLPALARSTRFVIDWQGGTQPPVIAAAIAAQIALVEGLPIRPEIIDFFAAQPIKIDTVAGGMSRVAPDGVHLARYAMPANNPELLHELLHRYHALRLPDGDANADVLLFFAAAKTGALYPPRAHMMSHPAEFFATVASAVLHGRLPRPPWSRTSISVNSPDFYAWIVAEFGLRTG